MDQAFGIREGIYEARLVDPGDADGMRACYRLRYAYFVQQRKWIAADAAHPGLELDTYDTEALHLAVFKNEDSQQGAQQKAQCIAGYLRLLPQRTDCGFMLEHEFRPLLPEEEMDALRQPGAVELSRLTVASVPDTDGAGDHPRGSQGSRLVLELLLKLLYRLALERGWNHFYVVVEAHWPVLLRRRFGLPFQIMGSPYTFPNGTVTVAASALLTDLEAAMARHSLEKLRWYQCTPPNTVESHPPLSSTGSSSAPLK